MKANITHKLWHYWCPTCGYEEKFHLSAASSKKYMLDPTTPCPACANTMVRGEGKS